MINKKHIIEYYDKSRSSYQDVWHLDDCLALHYGFWEKGVYSLKQALVRENQVLADLLDIKSTDKVLDAGCGVGGSSIFLSKNFNCQVHGITLSQEQVSLATQAAKNQSVSDLLNFSVQDFHHTNFDDDSFDVIWFVESFCHSDSPDKLLKEMFRILKPNGKILIADGFLSKEERNEKDRFILKKWLNNWAINMIPFLGTVTKSMTDLGYKDVTTLDYSREVSTSSLILYIYANLALLYGKLRNFIGKSYGNEITVKNTIGAKYQYLAFRKKLWRYNIVTALKPKATDKV